MRKKFRSKREKIEKADIDITSLLDILVILLVFLLKSYNASELKVNLAKHISLPDSKARDLGKYAPIIQVDKNKRIYLDNKEISIVIASRKEDKVLLANLKKRFESDIENKLIKTSDKDKPQLLNLIFDKDVPYNAIQQIMHTSALAGYGKFKLLVKGNYK
jgi:biopolymer transport protein ExbD